MQNTLSIASSLGKNDGHAWAMFDPRCSFDHALQGKSLGGPLPSPTWGSWAPPPGWWGTVAPGLDTPQDQGEPKHMCNTCACSRLSFHSTWKMLPLNTSCKAGLAQSHQKDMPNPKNGCPRAAGKLLGNWVPEALVVLQYLEQHGLPMPTLGLAHSVQLLDLGCSQEFKICDTYSLLL